MRIYIFLLFILFTASVFSQPLIIKKFLANPQTKIVVIDSTIKDTDLATKRAAELFNGIDTKIILLKEYTYNLDKYKDAPIIFWGLLKPSSIIWNSLTGIHEQAKENYNQLPPQISIVGFGKNPFTGKIFLHFAAKEEASLNFSMEIINQTKSYNAFVGTKLIESGTVDSNFNLLGENISSTRYPPITKDHVINDEDVTIYNYAKFDMTIVSVPTAIEFVYMPEDAKSVNQVGKDDNFRYLINSSYFNGTRDNAKHCGRLSINGNCINPIVAPLDKQLTHIVQYNKSTKNIQFVKRESFVSSKDSVNTLEFQTGPLVIGNNSVDTTIIKSSINGMRKAARTLIASINNKDIYFITVRANVNLIELGNYLTTLEVFKGKKLDVVNLDGGPSVSLYSKKFININFNSEANLPFLLGIK